MTADSGAVNIATPEIFRRHTQNVFLRQATGPLAFRKTLKVNPDNCPLSGYSNLQTKIPINDGFHQTYLYLYFPMADF